MNETEETLSKNRDAIWSGDHLIYIGANTRLCEEVVVVGGGGGGYGQLLCTKAHSCVQGGGGGCRFSCQFWLVYQVNALIEHRTCN